MLERTGVTGTLTAGVPMEDSEFKKAVWCVSKAFKTAWT